MTTRLRDILEDHVDEKFYLSEEKTAKLVAQLRDKEQKILAERKSDDYNPIYTPELYRKTMNGRRIKPANDVSPALTVQDRHGVVEPKMIGRVDLKGHDVIRRVYSPTGISPTLTTMGGGHREPKIAEVANGENLSYCIDANYTKGISPSSIGKGRRTHVEETKPMYRIRKLTPLECFRLQGFPDEYHEKLVEAGISNSQLYKMAGNAVTVNVIDAIGRRLLPLLDS